MKELYISFWKLSFENFPEGTFVHRRLTARRAKLAINAARNARVLHGASHHDLIAPYEKRRRRQHENLCRVLNDHFGIRISLRDFVLQDKVDGRHTFFSMRPLGLVRIDGATRLMIINCHYILAKRRSKVDDNHRFDVAPDSVTFHMFEEAVPRRRQTKSKNGMLVAKQSK
jgi:hypothetical protein